MTEYSSFQKLQDIYVLLNMQEIEYELEQDDEGWNVEIIGDGKILAKSEFGWGETKEEALDDAAERFFQLTPIIDNLPIKKLLKLMTIYRANGNKISDL